MRRRQLLLLALCALTGCATSAGQPAAEYQLVRLNSGSAASLRGIAVVNARVLWASGTGGTVLRSVDGGATWLARNVPAADSLDFRDIAAFDSTTAYVLSAGEDGRIYKTTDAGRSWSLQFRNVTKGAFFDCFDFWDARHGIALSDPVDGKLLLVQTTDGTHWQPVARSGLPPATPGEGAFAASGTCLVTAGRDRAYVATGGAARTRVFASSNAGQTWSASETPVPAGNASAGIFSLALRSPTTVLALGGDYRKPESETVLAMSTDAGKKWAPAGKTSYVSGAAFVPNSNTLAAVGTKGTRISHDRGVTWRTVDVVEYNAVQFAKDGTGFVVGPNGRIGRLVRQ